MNSKFNLSQRRKNPSIKKFTSYKKSYIPMKTKFKFLNRK